LRIEEEDIEKEESTDQLQLILNPAKKRKPRKEFDILNDVEEDRIHE